MIFRRAVLSDAAALAAAEQTQPCAAGWGESGFISELKLDCALIFCALEGAEVVGFVASRFTADTAEILNVAVRTPWQRRGVGRQLLMQSLTELKNGGVRQVSLEVAQDNAAACGLYEQAGLKRLGERKDFYGAGKSAWIVGKQL